MSELKQKITSIIGIHYRLGKKRGGHHRNPVKLRAIKEYEPSEHLEVAEQIINLCESQIRADERADERKRIGEWLEGDCDHDTVACGMVIPRRFCDKCIQSLLKVEKPER